MQLPQQANEDTQVVAGVPPSPSRMPAWSRRDADRHRDNTTRFLCAAAHLDDDFAADAVREFVVERTRAVAPSPGVDSHAVVREASAARFRRRMRDAVLVLCLALFVFCMLVAEAGTAFLVWLGAGFLIGLFVQLASNARLPDGLAAVAGALGVGRRDAPRWVLALLGAGTLLGLLESLVVDFNLYSVIALPLLAILVSVLVADEVYVWQLATRRFSRLGWRAAAVVPDEPRADVSPVIVYRGYHPFVGAGVRYQPWSTAVPLDRDPEKATGRANSALTTALLYEEVYQEILALRRSTPLSPSGRLAHLRIFDQVVVPADDLIEHCLVGDPRALRYLPSADGPPVVSVSRADANELAVNSEEWARYYLCLQIETWDRDLVLSIFVHFAMDESTFYIEWTPCVLPPIRAEYRRIDLWPSSYLTPVSRAFAELFLLPGTAFGRLLNAAGPIRPLPRGFHAARYGALHSLREVASGVRAGSEVTKVDLDNYFQKVDLGRYLRILERRFVRTVGRILDEHGYSSELFRRQAEMVITNNFSGNFAGPVVVGDNSGSVSGAGSVNVAAGSTSGAKQG